MSQLKMLPPIAAEAPKRILLIDADEASQRRRASMLQQRGVEVTCANDIEHARQLWQEDVYSLVMIDATSIYDEAVTFQKSIKEKRPKQMVKFLVGKPGLLSDSPPKKNPSPTIEQKLSAMKNAQATFAKSSNRYSRGKDIRAANSQIRTHRSSDRPQPVDEDSPKADKEMSFGDAIRRAGGE
jgi:hypothetical protein